MSAERLPDYRNAVSLLPPGTASGRIFEALNFAKNDLLAAELYASGQRWGGTPTVALALKAAVDAITSQTTSALTQSATLDEFAAMVRAATAFDNPSIPWRRAPENIRLPAITGDLTSYSVAEGQPKPVGKFSVATVAPIMRKVVGDAIATDELLRFSKPSAQSLLAREVAAAIALQTDTRLLNPNYGDSLTAAGTVFSSSGSTIAAFDADIRHALRVVGGSSGDGHGGGLRRAVWLMPQSILSFLAMLRTAANEFAYPSLSLPTPTLAGLPVYITGGLDSAASPLEGAVVLVDASQCVICDSGPMPLTIARDASIQLVDNPATPATSTVSLFQANLICLRAERYIGFAPVTQYAVATIDDIAVNY